MVQSSKIDQKFDIKIIKQRRKEIEFLTSTSLLGLLTACGGGGETTPDDNSDTDRFNTDEAGQTPLLSTLAHNTNGTTHLPALSPLVTEPYQGYPTFINGDFDFTNLEIDYSRLEFSSKAGPTYDQTDGYTGMVYYGNFGDVTGDGKPDMIISGWTVDSGNASGRLFLLELDPQNGITNVEWTDNEGTAAPWVDDFDGDGMAEIMSIGFYDFPVAPAPTVYFDGGVENGVSVGPHIDSHESSVVDFDGDGDLDVVAISYGNVNGLISLFRNNGEGFDHEYLPTDHSDYFATGSSIDYADLDGDGQGEFIVGDYGGDGGLAILKLNEDNTFLNSPEWKTVLEARPYFESDTFDGLESIFTSANPNADLQTIRQARSHDIAFQIIDLDSDGDLDILSSTMLWSNTTPMGVYQILINQGDGSFIDETDQRLFNYSLTSYSSHDPLLIDVNNDGFLDLLSPDASAFGGNDGLNEGAWVDMANLSEANHIYLNDGEGFFLQITQAPFSRPGTFETHGSHYPDKWIPIVHSDGSLGFVQLGHSWTNYPNGEYDVFNYAHFDQILYTGPKFVNPAEYGAPGFNEFYVLRNNQDVQELVKDGTYGSALEWYLETQPTDIKTFAANAKVVGSDAEDIIILREGDETAVGYAGNDTITGGSGADTFVFTKGENGTDTITDFSFADGDRIDLSSYGISSEETAVALISDETLIQLVEENSTVRYEDIEAAAISIDGNVVAYFHGVSAAEFIGADGWLA